MLCSCWAWPFIWFINTSDPAYIRGGRKTEYPGLNGAGVQRTVEGESLNGSLCFLVL